MLPVGASFFRDSCDRGLWANVETLPQHCTALSEFIIVFLTNPAIIRHCVVLSSTSLEFSQQPYGAIIRIAPIFKCSPWAKHCEWFYSHSNPVLKVLPLSPFYRWEVQKVSKAVGFIQLETGRSRELKVDLSDSWAHVIFRVPAYGEFTSYWGNCRWNVKD